MRIHRTALKHGCPPDAIVHALSTSAQRVLIGEDPDRWLYLGVDGSGRLLEIITLQGDDGDEVVIHAMKLRKKYVPRGGRR
ncbi:hypothetical protein KVF89_16010 [Nocardioides carbamazepini]|uniref:hypothetical protein n=1 Tax=Nocardioides carbamazepini TaxID=2854259 RepID=UPI0021499B5A|nr:hypothetical protein [Nocardioides carbamazepini]MCR1784045.1 hypothetical protein [Nocardioides carbamazepini]